jgi:hypothetical protein
VGDLEPSGADQGKGGQVSAAAGRP